MKIFLSSDLRVGMESTVNLSVQDAHRWTRAAAGKLSSMLEKAARMGADLAFFPGRIFGADHVTEMTVLELCNVVRAAGPLPVILCPDEETYCRLSGRKDRPDNMYLLNDSGGQNLTIGKAVLSRTGESIQIKVPSENVTAEIMDVAGAFFDGAVRLPQFEPSGWQEAQSGLFGYAVMDTGQGGHKTFCTEETLFSYRTAEVYVEPEDDAEALRTRTAKAIAGMDGNVFLRLTLKGKTAFGKTADIKTVRDFAQETVFHAEVFDSTSMDINERALENDISLQSEFVRLVLQDDSLSDADRSRLISCGWNALSGKEGSGE